MRYLRRFVVVGGRSLDEGVKMSVLARCPFVGRVGMVIEPAVCPRIDDIAGGKVRPFLDARGALQDRGDGVCSLVGEYAGAGDGLDRRRIQIVKFGA